MAAGPTGCQTTTSRGGAGGTETGDLDGDGLSNAAEQRLGTDPDSADTDGDGLSDGEEVALGTSPKAGDSDGDGFDDAEDDDPLVAAEDDSHDDGGDGEVDSDGVIEETEPNDRFETAAAADLGTADTAAIRGSLDTGGDIDVFDLGPLSAGDRLSVGLSRTGGFFEFLVAVFDEAGNLYSTGSDGSDDFDAQVDEVIRHSSPQYFLAVTHATVLTASGDYEVEVRLQRGGDVPDPVGQVVFLDFDGGAVDDPFLGPVELGSFDAADVDPIYEDQTDVITNSIVATTQENFAGFNLTILTSDADTPPEGAAFSTICFGGFNRLVFGIGEGVDPYNRDSADSAIVYTGSFTPEVFAEPPSAEELGVAIGNIASHELGHLLGLQDVNDQDAVMNQESTPDQLLQDKVFTSAELADDVVPLGVQDAPALLTEILGMR
ncbi:MAG: hypothetical protein ACYS7M_09560 [Planctomycetota bacterium]